jgi:hypothetical protein
VAIQSDREEAEHMSVEVVFCSRCGTTLHMFKAEESD